MANEKPQHRTMTPIAFFGEQRSLADVIRDAAAAQGITIEPAKGMHFCGGFEGAGLCDRVVPERGGYCDACSVMNSLHLRRNLLKPARATLPDWAHAAFDVTRLKATVRPEILRVVGPWRPFDEKTGAPVTLALLGDTGAGKTTAAVAICKRILDAAESKSMPTSKFQFARGLRFIKARTLSGATKRVRLGVGAPPEVTEALDATLLVLDELGFETRDDAIDDILDKRYSRPDAVTIVTSGLTMVQLGDRYGEATRRRFTELGPTVESFKRGAVAC